VKAKDQVDEKLNQSRSAQDKLIKKMNGPSDFPGSMGGRMLSHPMYDRAAADAAAHTGAGLADALLNSRYAAAAAAGGGAGAGAGGMDPLLLQQELRRQDLLAASGGYGAAAAAESNAAMLARREEELVRIRDAHNRIMEAELAARAMRDRVVADQAAARAAQAQQDQSFRNDSIERIVALQEHQAARKREIEQLRHAELGETARAFGGVLHRSNSALQTAGVGADRFLDPAAAVYRGAGAMTAGPGNAPPPANLTEEMALREQIIQRRMIEEEIVKRQQQHQQQQQQAALSGQQASADREHLTRLLQLQHMSDEDLIRRATELENAQSAAVHESLELNKIAALEQHLLEARLLRSNGLQRFQGARGDLDLIDQAHADAAVARGFSAGPEGRVNQGSPMQHAGIPRYSNSPNNPQPLRYFNNGIEVDMNGNPLPNNSPNPARANLNNAPSPASVNAASLESNIIAKFLTVVVSRVPEIAPAVADLLPEGGDPMLLKREFPNVVDATLAELKSIQERSSKGADNNSFDVHHRVTNCIAAIEPYKVDLSTAGGLNPMPAAPPAMAAAGIMRRMDLPEPSLDPNSCQPLMPNNPMKLSSIQSVQTQSPVDLSAGQQASLTKLDNMKSNVQSDNVKSQVQSDKVKSQVQSDKVKSQVQSDKGKSHVQSDNGKIHVQSDDVKGQVQPTPIVNKKKETKQESPVEDNISMMAAYKSNKKANKKVAKKVKKTNNKVRPKLVHRASPVEKVELDLNAVKKTAHAERERTNSNSSCKSKSSTESSQNEIKLSASFAEAHEKSRPMKKRRVSDETKVNVKRQASGKKGMGGSGSSSGAVNKKAVAKGTNGQVNKASNPGPHGGFTHQLFPGKKSMSHAVAATKKAKSKASVEKLKKGTTKSKKAAPKALTVAKSTNPKPRANAESAMITDDSEHHAGTRRDSEDDNLAREHEDDSHYGAASVLLGLMRK